MELRLADLAQEAFRGLVSDLGEALRLAVAEAMR